MMAIELIAVMLVFDVSLLQNSNMSLVTTMF